jgi:regulation of enolase protein 1 (concanavalin A-like superfamily)
LQSLKNGRWLNQPANSEASDIALSVTTDANTDFWRETHYGFVRDNGHFYAFQADGDFTAQVRVQAHFEHLYDQAGLMVRLDERRWVKTGIEFSEVC